MFIYLFRLCWVFIAVCGLSLIVGNGGYSRVMVCGLLIAVAPLGVEHRLEGAWASVGASHGLSSCGKRP